jgi:hypothetical protein
MPPILATNYFLNALKQCRAKVGNVLHVFGKDNMFDEFQILEDLKKNETQLEALKYNCIIISISIVENSTASILPLWISITCWIRGRFGQPLEGQHLCLMKDPKS